MAAAPLRVLGIDPGLTRCGVGVVDVAPDRRATLVYVSVIRTPPHDPLELRLLAISEGIRSVIAEHRPAAVAVERVFAQANLRTVMGVAQVSGIALAIAAERQIPIGLHTPSEVKAAITGYGSANKKQVGAMVARVLGLAAIPQPADAADALALAVCHAWRGAGAPWGSAGGRADDGGTPEHRGDAPETPAQRAWRAAERATRR